MTNLKFLDLESNQIRDIKPLVANMSFGRGVRICVRDNPLGQDALCNDIPKLKARYVFMEYDGKCDEGDDENSKGRS